MGFLMIGGEPVQDMGATFKNWTETGWDATFEGCVQTAKCGPGQGAYGVDAKNRGLRRYALRPSLRRLKDPKHPPMEAVQKSIKKFVLHHDGLDSSRLCWEVLHNERGLSCHFLIDNDGTIFQTLDLAYMGFHAAKYNIDSIGVEFCNRGDYKKDTAFYSKRGLKRTTKLCKINNHTIEAWDFTPEQYLAMIELAAVLVRHLPELPLEYPTEPGSSKPYWGTLGPVDALGDSFPAMDFRGYIAHYHLTTRKWDPGPFDFKEFIDKLRGQRSFPLWLPGMAKVGERPLIPSDPSPDVASKKIIDESAKYTQLNETQAGGGFFPVGPWGATRLWHGGIHLPADKDAAVHAPFAGRVVAARTGGASGSPIGSTNFVLLRHDINVGKPLRFFSLYMHLADEQPGDAAPKWLASATRKELDASRSVLGFDHPVEAGELIGHVGVVGPDDLSASQIHFEIFSRDELFRGDPDWQMVDGAAGYRMSDVPEINSLIDNDKDGRLSREELLEFYASGEVNDDLRRMVTYHVSEWTDEPPWGEELAKSLRDFRKRGGPKSAANDADDLDYDIGALAQDQLEPFIWWTEPVATALNLPKDGTVYHYHPMRFIEKINLRLLDRGGQVIDASQAKEVDTSKITDDGDADGMFEEAKEFVPDDLHLTIDDLEKGWEGDRPAPAVGGGGGKTP
ncbi:MAG TPA: N-acetylmuramoyl-L-alanine amidase [Kofleriaceae bacterium]|nr:N-acetylmuramoyl-L-alanine amidase [Kofleriaceae bacterium]